MKWPVCSKVSNILLYVTVCLSLIDLLLFSLCKYKIFPLYLDVALFFFAVVYNFHYVFNFPEWMIIFYNMLPKFGIIIIFLKWKEMLFIFSLQGSPVCPMYHNHYKITFVTGNIKECFSSCEQRTAFGEQSIRNRPLLL